MQSGFANAARFNKAPPPNYVAGLGRGAAGFTTRSDIGPMRPMADLGGEPKGDEGGDDETDDVQQPPADNSDRGSLFANIPYDQDDREADDIYEAVDDRMDSKRRIRREKMEEDELNQIRKERPNIHDQFSDLKRHLGGITPDEWAAIPEIGDYSYKNKKQKTEGYTLAPDSLLDAARKERESNAVVDMHTLAGTHSTVTQGGGTTDLSAIGKAQTKLLGHKLDRAADSVTGQSTVNPRAYMHEMSAIQIASDSDISDYKKARALLKSVRETNPGHAPAWVASARLEEVAGKIMAARMMINKGCESCPQSEDVWIEASRLQTPDNARALLARAVTHMPTSVKIWQRAAELEGDDVVKRKRVLRKALEVIPNSVVLWKAAVDLETPQGATIMLRRAVECCPDSVDLWLALAKLENYTEARKVLNTARKNIPNDVTIWITASQLEEANGKADMCEKIIKKAIEAMQKQQVLIDRMEWLRQACECEKAGTMATAQAIARLTVGLNVDEQDRQRTWMDDAEQFTTQSFVEVARTIYDVLIAAFPGKKKVWSQAVSLEQAHGTPASVKDMLEKACKACPRAEVLWLKWAKECWKAGEVEAARKVLTSAHAANPDSEQIWLAAVKLEYENGGSERARKLLDTARERAGTERVWMKSAKLERELGNLEAAIQLARQGLEIHPQFDKLWLIASQVEEQLGNAASAREMLLNGVKRCPQSVACWKCLAALETRHGNVSAARSTLERSRIKIPHSPELWIAAIRLEIDGARDTKTAENLLAKALQDCPKSGELLALSIELAPRPQKRAKSMDALQRCDDAHVITAVAKLFWMDRRLDKARKWFNRAVGLNPDLGDAWATFYKFEVQEGNEEQQKDVMRRCVEVDPHHGEAWCTVAKNVQHARATADQVLIKTALLIP